MRTSVAHASMPYSLPFRTLGQMGSTSARRIREPRQPLLGSFLPCTANKHRMATSLQAMRSVVVTGDEGQELSSEFDIPEDAELLVFSMPKPMGILLAETPDGGSIVVEEVTEGGNAESSGVNAGDIVVAVTARSQEEANKKERTREALFGRLVLFQTLGETFDTVMAAIASNRCSQCEIQVVVARTLQQ